MASKSDGLSCVGEEGGSTELQQQQPVTPGNTKTAATGKLESLSKDDLIKFTKKQILLQQKMKTKCEELTKKLQQKSDETDSNIQYKMLKAEYEVMKAEREELLAAYSQSQQAQERYLQEYQELESHIEILKQEKNVQNAKIQTLSHDNKALEEQLDCMKMKDETMATTFQCIQQEQNAVVDENKALKQEMIVLSQARDDMMLAMKSLQQSQKTEDVNESAADGSNRHYETLQQEMNKIQEQLKDAVRIKTDLERENSELRLVSEKHEALVKQKVKMLEYIKELETENDEHQMALEKLKSEKENVTKDFAVFRKSSSNFKERLEEATRLMKDIQNQRDGLLKERDDAIKESQDNQSQVESCQMGIAKLTKISHKLKTENEELNQRNDALEKCVTEMYDSNETKEKEGYQEQEKQRYQEQEKQRYQEQEKQRYQELEKQRYQEQDNQIVVLRREIDKFEQNTVEFRNNLDEKSTENISLVAENKALIDQLQNLNIELQNLNESTQKELSELQTQLDAKQQELDELQTIADVSARDHNDERESWKLQLDDMTKEYELTRSERDEGVVKSQRLEDDAEKLKAEITELQNRLRNVDSAKSEIENKLSKASLELEEFKTKCETLQEKSDVDETNLAEIHELKQNLETEIDQLLEKNRCLNETLDSMTCGDVTSDLRNNLIELDGKCKNLKEELEITKSEIEDLTTQRNQLQDDNNKLNEELVTSERSYQELLEHCQQLEAGKLVETMVDSVEVEENMHLLQDENLELSTRVSELENVVGSFEDNKSRDELRSSLEASEAGVMEFQESYASHKHIEVERGERLVVQTHRSVDRYAMLQGQIEENEQLIAQLSSKNQMLDNLVHELQNELTVEPIVPSHRLTLFVKLTIQHVRLILDKSDSIKTEQFSCEIKEICERVLQILLEFDGDESVLNDDHTKDEEEHEAAVVMETVSVLTSGVEDVSDLVDDSTKRGELADLTLELEKYKTLVEKQQSKEKELWSRIDSVGQQKQRIEYELEQANKRFEDWEETFVLIRSEKEQAVERSGNLEEKEIQLQRELEELTLSLNDALQERDSLRDEMCKMTEKDGFMLHQIQALNGKIVEVMSEKDSLQFAIDEIKGQNEETEKSILELQSQLTDVTNLKTDLEVLNEESICEIKKLKDAGNLACQNLAEHRQQFESCVRDNELLKTKIDAFQSENNDLESRSSLLGSNLEKSSSRIEELESELMKQEEDKEKSTEEIERLVKERETLHERIDQLNHEFRSSREDLESALESSQERAEIINTKLGGLEIEHENLTEKYVSVDEAGKLATENLRLLSIRRDELETEVEHLKRNLELSLEGSSSQVQVLQGENDELRTEIKSLKTELNETIEQSDIAKNELEIVTRERDNVQTEIDMTSAKYAELQKKMLQFKKLLKELKTQESTLKSEKAVLENFVCELRSEMSSKCSELDKLQVEVDSLKSSTVNAQDALRSTDEDNIHLKNMSSKYEQSVKHLDNELQQSQSKMDLLRESSAKMEQTLVQKDLEIRDLNEEHSQFNDEISRLKSIVEELNKSSAITLSELEMKTLQLRDVDASLKEKEELIQRLQQQVNDRQQLRENVEDLTRQLAEIKSQEQISNVKSASEINATEQTILKLETSVKEAEDKSNKFKVIAIKTKKELAENKAKIEQLNQEIDDLRNEKEEHLVVIDNLKSEVVTFRAEICEFESMKREYEVLESRHRDLKQGLEDGASGLEKSEQRCRVLSDELQHVIQQLSDSKNNLAEFQLKMDSQLSVVTVELKTCEERLKGVGEERDVQRMQKEHTMTEVQEMNCKLTELRSQLDKDSARHSEIVAKLQAQLEEKRQELANVKKDMKQSSMMDLEMADYERTVQNLHDQLTDRDKTIEELREDSERLQDNTKTLSLQLESSESQKSKEEDRGNKIKQLLLKTKKDLAEAKKQESELLKSDAELRGQLEAASQLQEETKVYVSTLSADNQKLNDRIKNSKDTSSRTLRTVEMKLQAALEDLELTRSELVALQAEYDSYKIRAHSVLKQQRTKTHDVSNDIDRQERERLEKVVEQLRLKLHDTSEQLSTSIGEAELLQDEIERLTLRQNKLVQDLQFKELFWKEEFEGMKVKVNLSSSEHADTVQQFAEQNETLSNTFKDQMKSMQADHHATIEALQKQLDMTDNEVIRLQRELQKYQQLTTPLQQARQPSPQPLRFEQTPLMELRDPRQEERQQGEGMEHPDVENLRSVSSTPTLVPFEDLLNSPIDNSFSSKSVASSIFDEDILQDKLARAEKKIEHLTELENENEATILRLTEQAKILKHEIRRLERNQERETIVSNMEYLKNIILKFVSLSPGVERQQLIPVLATMLKLSPDEKVAMATIAAGGDDGDTAAPSGWSSYLHRWSGLM